MGKESGQSYDPVRRNLVKLAGLGFLDFTLGKRLPLFPENPSFNFTRQSSEKEIKRPFENKVGWAYTAALGASHEQILRDIRRMKRAGMNMVYLGHMMQGDLHNSPHENGLGFPIYWALKTGGEGYERARAIYKAVLNVIDAAAQEGLEVILAVDYRMQKGVAWSADNQSTLRLDRYGEVMDPWDVGPSASPYSWVSRIADYEYASWVVENFINRYPNILAVNLADEPEGGDYSEHALDEFYARYGVPMARADVYQIGEFQTQVIADYAIGKANLWKLLAPKVRSMMTFHVNRFMPFFELPAIQKVFREAPDTFIVSEDTHLKDDGSPGRTVTPQDKNPLRGLVQTMGWNSKLAKRSFYAWTAANSWGLDSIDPYGEARENLQIIQDGIKGTGGQLAGIMAWMYENPAQTLFDSVENDRFFDYESQELAQIRDTVSQIVLVGKPDKVLYLPQDFLYPIVGWLKPANAEALHGIFADITERLDQEDFSSGRTIYTTDPQILQATIDAGAKAQNLLPNLLSLSP